MLLRLHEFFSHIEKEMRTIGLYNCVAFFMEESILLDVMKVNFSRLKPKCNNQFILQYSSSFTEKLMKLLRALIDFHRII